MPFTTTASGLQFEDTVVGSGAEAKPGRTVTVHYTGHTTGSGSLPCQVARHLLHEGQKGDGRH